MDHGTIAELVLAFVVSGVTGLATGYLGATLKLRSKFAPLLPSFNGDHTHQFDTMIGDGKGWRCGVCGIRKEEP